MSTAFIRKTPNYPLLRTVFHLPQGKQRLLIRKAALSTVLLVGLRVGDMGPFPSRNPSTGSRRGPTLALAAGH